MTPATEIIGKPSSLYLAMGDALYRSGLVYGSTMAEMVVPRNVTAMTNVEQSVRVWKLAMLNANRYATKTDGMIINKSALTGVPVRSSNFATDSGSRRSNAAAKMTRVEERKTVAHQPNHHKLISAITRNCTNLFVVRNAASIAGYGQTGSAGATSL